METPTTRPRSWTPRDIAERLGVTARVVRLWCEHAHITGRPMPHGLVCERRGRARWVIYVPEVL